MRKLERKHIPLDAAIDCATADELIAERRADGLTVLFRLHRRVAADELIVERQEIFGIVARELARLPQHEKEAVEARMSGDSYRKVARRHKVCHETVRNWAKSGFAKLRPQLEGCL